MKINELLANPEYLEDITHMPESLRQVEEMITACHRQGKFRLIFDSEGDLENSNSKVYALGLALIANAKSYHIADVPGQWVEGCSGPGWFSITVGCLIDSGTLCIFADESIYYETR